MSISPWEPLKTCEHDRVRSDSPSLVPIVLAQAGVGYLCEWLNDEQPYPMTGGLFSLPTILEMDDPQPISGIAFPESR